MPIKRKDFEAGNFKGRRHSNRLNHPVAILLKKNISLAFKVEEISKRTKMNEDTVRSMLGCLKRDGVVIHRTPYFAWKKK